MNSKMTARERLLEAGLQLVQEKGLRGLVVRELTAVAGVNLGSFVYHFGTRDAFLEQLVEQWYGPLYEQVRLSVAPVSGENALDSLQRVIGELIDFGLLHQRFIAHVMADAVAGEGAAQKFILNLPARHPQLLLMLVMQAQQQGLLQAGPPLQLLGFIMCATGLPLLLTIGVLTHCDWLPDSIAPATDWLASADGARQRLQWALRGVSVAKQHEN